jgi:hypothetical protein
MGRPIRKFYFGNPSSELTNNLSIIIAGNPDGTVITDGYIIKQKGNRRFLISSADGAHTGQVTLVNKSSGFLLGEGGVTATDSTGSVTSNVYKIQNHRLIIWDSLGNYVSHPWVPSYLGSNSVPTGYLGLNMVLGSSGITTPGAPTIGAVTRGNMQASIAFTAPGTGSPPILYTATSTPGNITGTGTASPIVVTGLTNGTAYTFTVTASNSAGTGPASSSSASVTPATTPGIPTSISALAASSTSATITFTAPSSTGGSAITGYTVTSTPGSITASGANSPITVTGLTTGTPYTFTVHATNAIGNSSESSASNSVTPT